MPKGFDRRLKEYRNLLADEGAVEREFRAEAQRVQLLEKELAESNDRLQLLASLLTAQENLHVPGQPSGGRSSRTQSRQRGIRSHIASIMRSRPAGPWTPAELEEALGSRGIKASRSNVQTTLARMVAAGEVAKIRRGAYRLARDRKEVSA